MQTVMQHSEVRLKLVNFLTVSMMTIFYPMKQRKSYLTMMKPNSNIQIDTESQITILLRLIESSKKI